MGMPTVNGIRMPYSLKNFSVFLDDQGFFGVVTKGKLPDLSVKTEDHRGSGMEFNRKFDFGLEDIVLTFTLAEANDFAINKVAILNNSSTKVVFRGATNNDDSPEATIPIIVTCLGALHKVELNEWTSGSAEEDTFTLNCKFFEVKIDGAEVIYIDGDNLVRRIEGVDQMTAIRTAINLGV